MKVLVLVLGAALIVSTSSAASSCEEPANLLAAHNCGFNETVAGWIDEDQEGVSEHDPAEGVSAPGALAISGPEGSAVIFSPCIPVKPATGYRARASIRVASGDLFSCSITARQYSDTACSEGRDRLELSADITPQQNWQAASGETTTSDTSRSARLHFECNGENGFRVLVDDVMFSERGE